MGTSVPSAHVQNHGPTVTKPLMEKESRCSSGRGEELTDSVREKWPVVTVGFVINVDRYIYAFVFHICSVGCTTVALYRHGLTDVTES